MSAEVKNTAHAFLKAYWASALANRKQLVGLFASNMRVKHGIPYEDNSVDATLLTAMLTTPPPKAKPLSQTPKRDASNTTIHMRPVPPNPHANPPARPASEAPKQSWLSKAAPWLMALCAGAAIGYALSLPNNPPPAAGTVVQVPVEHEHPPMPEIKLPPESPLIFLDERGHNQP